MPSFFQHLVWLPIRFIMLFFYNTEIKGLENLKKINTNIIFASNHISELDPLLLVSSLPFFSKFLPLYFVTLEKSFYKTKWSGWKKYLYGGIFFKIIGGYPAFKGLNNYELALSNHINLANEGRNIVIFPAGKIFKGNSPIKAKGGVAYLSYKTKLPIIPVFIDHENKISFKNLFNVKPKFKIVFGLPVYTKDIFQNINEIIVNENRNDYEIAASVLMDKIINLCALN